MAMTRTLCVMRQMVCSVDGLAIWRLETFWIKSRSKS